MVCCKQYRFREWVPDGAAGSENQERHRRAVNGGLVREKGVARIFKHKLDWQLWPEDTVARRSFRAKGPIGLLRPVPTISSDLIFTTRIFIACNTSAD